jgi:hypothetical protein
MLDYNVYASDTVMSCALCLLDLDAIGVTTQQIFVEVAS